MKMQVAQQFIDKHNIKRVTTWMGSFGHDLLKCSHLFGSLPTLRLMARQKPKDFKRCANIDDYYIVKPGNVQGGHKLLGAAAYTPQFCAELSNCWLRAYNFRPASSSAFLDAVAV